MGGKQTLAPDPCRFLQELQNGAGAGAGAGGLHLVLSSFSSSISFLEALTLLDTSFPWEKSRWRSLKVRLSGASLGMEFSCS